MKKLLFITIYTILICMIFYYIFIPKIIKKRAKHLGYLHYNSIVDDMVEKDTNIVNGYELYYLINGDFDKKY